ncbi:U3 snoRNP protein [Allomyces javanicus]|nr:U3 snoRNP protein [Allomyces javanicus]
MADGVQLQLEAMVAELRDAQRKKLFTEVEVKSIVKQRTNFEYALRRRGANKADFIKYIDYEWNLEKIRRKRVSRMGLRYKASIIDYAGPKRLHHLYNRAVAKFPGDVALWLRYIDMAKKLKSYRRLGSVFARAIQLHPRNSALWILAAKWEFERNANTASARKLMQRAVHINREAKELWAEWFKMETMYVAKIRVRKELAEKLKGKAGAAADEDASDASSEAEEDSDEEDDDAMQVLGDSPANAMDVDEDDDGSDAEDTLARVGGDTDSALDAKLRTGRPSESAEDTDDDPVVAYTIPRLVFDEALVAVPNDVDLCRACMHVAANAHGAQSLVDHLLARIRESLAPRNAHAALLVTAWRVIPGVATVAPSDPTYPALLHAAIQAYDDDFATSAPDQHALRRDVMLQFLLDQNRVAGRVDKALRTYIGAQIQRHALAYLRVADLSLPAPTGSASPAPTGNAPLLASTFQLLLQSLPKFPQPVAGVTPNSVASLATSAFPTHVPLILARTTIDPAWAPTAVTARVTACDVVDLLLHVHSLVANGKYPPADQFADDDDMCLTRTAAHALAQWKRVQAAPSPATDADRVLTQHATFLASALRVLPVTERGAFRDRLLRTYPATSLEVLAALVDAEIPDTPLARSRELYMLGAQRWPGSVAWWLRYLTFEVKVAKDLAQATQVYMRAARAVSSADADELAAKWNLIKG